MSNELFQNALKKKAQKVPPVWFMRQAGRYHQHYQKLKEKHTFMELCKVPELAAEVALGPVQEFDFDVSILFSDLLFPLEALGLGLRYDPGPILDRQLNWQNINELKSIEEALPDLAFQKKAMQLTREVLPKNKSLIGFVGGPWTLFTYASLGGHDGNLILAKTQLSLFEKFCEKLVPLLVQNIQLQLEGGAEVVMIFDTAAGEVSPHLFTQFIQPQIEKLAKAHPGRLGYYSKSTQNAHIENLMTQAHWAGFGVDHRWPLSQLLKSKRQGFLQGNFDQALLFCEPTDFKKHLEAFLGQFRELSLEERAGWVCGLGHGVLPKTPERNVKEFVQFVRKYFDE